MRFSWVNPMTNDFSARYTFPPGFYQPRRARARREDGGDGHRGHGARTQRTRSWILIFLPQFTRMGTDNRGKYRIGVTGTSWLS